MLFEWLIESLFFAKLYCKSIGLVPDKKGRTEDFAIV